MQHNDSTAADIAREWFSVYAQAITTANPERVAQTLAADGWFRDVLTLTWDFRALEGTDKIIDYVGQHLGPGDISNLELVENDVFCAPVYAPEWDWVEAVFTFETRVATGRGYARLVPGEETGSWIAASVCMMAQDLKGYEESGNESGIYGGHTLSWTDIIRERKAEVEADPHVLIIGCGQTGLQIAARFKQMNIPSLVIEKNDRVGDNWRKRYPTLSLHTVRNHHALLYQPYPHNWPTFTPRDKLADWFESYAVAQDLSVWKKSVIEGRPIYHDDTQRWDVTINRDGQKVDIHPAHIVMATGTLGDPLVPDFKNRDLFKGIIRHSSQYQGGAEYAGKKVLVVGAGNSSIDICQDLCFHKAQVTMIQRSSSCVVSAANFARNFAAFWLDGVPVEYGDFKFGTQPLGHLKKLMQRKTDAMWEEEKELHAKLRKGGVALNMGPEGQGLVLRVFERSGGYWIDQGAADMIASGDIRVKQGVQPTAFTATGLEFEDGTELMADAVIFATSYQNIRDSSRKIFGNDTIDKTGNVYGLDDEGELLGSYRPTGHPGLWFGTGDFYVSRTLSKILAMQIVALREGLMTTGQTSVFKRKDEQRHRSSL